MKLHRLVFTLCVAFCLTRSYAEEKKPQKEWIHQEMIPLEQQNQAYRLLNICEEATAREVDRNGARPTILSRVMAIWATAVYDTWACYDEKAVGSRLGGTLRQPKAAHTLENKKKAISFASHYALLDAFPTDKEYLDGELKKLGYNPDESPSDPKSPQGVASIVVKAITDYRHNDGANQLANEIGGTAGKPYSDYTYYKPVNLPDKIKNADHWQPIVFDTKDGGKATPPFLTPHWYRVKPFLIESSAQFRPGPPPNTVTDGEELKKQTDEVLKSNATLTPEQKAIVEFMRDGPRSTGQSGHWLRFAQDVSRRDKHDLDADVKLYFVIANVAFDAFISCWETKRFYDSSRPWTLVRHYNDGKQVKGWAGPEGGVKEMDAKDWHPFSPYTFITPPFPGYTSGHATVSGACAKLLELFTGNDHYGFVEKRKPGALTEKQPGEEVILQLPTFTATADMAALSRMLGGYHIAADNNVGLKVGRELATWSWPKYQAFFDGTAQPRP